MKKLLLSGIAALCQQGERVRLHTVRRLLPSLLPSKPQVVAAQVVVALAA